MKIGIVCYPTFGGSGVVATELGIALSDKGHEVHFITYKQPVRLELLSHHIHFHEVVVPQYPLFQYQPYELALSSKLVNVVKEHQLELLHVHYAIPHAYAGYMAKKILEEEGIKIPMVTTLHGTDITLVGSHPFYKPAVTFSIKKSDAVTSVSQNLKEETLRLFGLENGIDVVPNFIDMQKYNVHYTDCQRAMMASSNERIVAHVSNLRPVKRTLDVIEIFDRILKKIPAKLIMVGEGPDKEAAEDLCIAKGIDQQVLFLGNSSEVNKILSFTDLFLLPSEKESFGLAALEAMASGVPVVSSNTGGLPEVNQHGVSGYLNDIGDVAGMADHAISILENPETLAKFKRQAREVASKFQIDQIVPLYEKVYQKALDHVLS